MRLIKYELGTRQEEQTVTGTASLLLLSFYKDHIRIRPVNRVH